MAIIQGGSVANNQEVDLSLASRVSLQPPQVIAADGGRYEISLVTGLATLLSAHTATAGHFAYARWGSATKTALVDYVRIGGVVITDFTTFQRFHVAGRLARGFTASGSGGTAATITADNCKLRPGYATTAFTDLRVATTADLTAGTQTIDTQPFIHCIIGTASDGATVANIPNATERDGHSRGPIILTQDTGLVFSNEVLMGAAGTATLTVTLGWREVLNANLPVGI